ncbi:unnamed protein product [Trypanosoma congolense IL3000]|uniref:WGS project CAEQ00000000 data, annotated contig 551 n=1 Tax=Trypanosoma congolense (strain IL3000) TaxID=1068625 RepID=F9WGU5_TRYCI|nr:unnamed protein product [Trypanosoma congolense IL3000]
MGALSSNGNFENCNVGGGKGINSFSRLVNRGFNFSLDNFNNLSPPIYVTDALGELLLQEECSTMASAVRRDIDVEDLPFEIHAFCSAGTDSVKEWLSRWLVETNTFSHNVQGVFERQLDMMLHSEIAIVNPVQESEEGERGETASMCGGESGSQTLPWFVTTGLNDIS